MRKPTRARKPSSRSNSPAKYNSSSLTLRLLRRARRQFKLFWQHLNAPAIGKRINRCQHRPDDRRQDEQHAQGHRVVLFLQRILSRNQLHVRTKNRRNRTNVILRPISHPLEENAFQLALLANEFAEILLA